MPYRLLGDRCQKAASIHQHTQAVHIQASTQAMQGQVHMHTDKIYTGKETRAATNAQAKIQGCWGKGHIYIKPTQSHSSKNSYTANYITHVIWVLQAPGVSHYHLTQDLLDVGFRHILTGSWQLSISVPDCLNINWFIYISVPDNWMPRNMSQFNLPTMLFPETLHLSLWISYAHECYLLGYCNCQKQSHHQKVCFFDFVLWTLAGLALLLPPMFSIRQDRNGYLRSISDC